MLVQIQQLESRLELAHADQQRTNHLLNVQTKSVTDLSDFYGMLQVIAQRGQVAILGPTDKFWDMKELRNENARLKQLIESYKNTLKPSLLG